jgi:hypothetical protein
VLREQEKNGRRAQWQLTREKILMFFGLMLIGAEFTNAELLGGTFHVEFLLGGLALCGISIAQWGDKR